MELFVEQDSIVRKIWGKSDTVLFIFAGNLIKKKSHNRIKCDYGFSYVS